MTPKKVATPIEKSSRADDRVAVRHRMERPDHRTDDRDCDQDACEFEKSHFASSPTVSLSIDAREARLKPLYQMRVFDTRASPRGQPPAAALIPVAFTSFPELRHFGS